PESMNGSTVRQGLGNLLGPRKLFSAEHDVDDLVRPGVTDDMRCEFLELAHDFGFGCEADFAATRRLDGLLERYAILQMHFDAHHVPVVRAAGGDRRVMHHAYFFR